MFALAVGPFEHEVLRSLSAVTAEAGMTLLTAPAVDEARRLLRVPSRVPQAVLVSFRADATGFVRFLRESPDLFAVPVLALIPCPTERELRRAFEAGADDVLVEGDARGVAFSLRNLAALELRDVQVAWSNLGRGAQSEAVLAAIAATDEAVNDLLSITGRAVARQGAEQRSSTRIGYAALCAFREGGLMEPSYGMTHDVSRDGLHVHTLDPLQLDTRVWVELRTPSGVPVHLRGVVAWRRVASRVGGAAPGFGLRLEPAHCPPADLMSYLRGYDQLLTGQRSN